MSAMTSIRSISHGLASPASVCLSILMLVPSIVLGPMAAASPSNASGGSSLRAPLAQTTSDDDAIRRLVLQELASSRSLGKDAVIETITIDGDWALAVAVVGTSSQSESIHTESQFFVVRRMAGSWQISSIEDDNYANWVLDAPDVVVHPSLQEYLLDHHALLFGAEVQAVSLPELKLPWFNDSNPKYISGYLYGEATHVGADWYAMDWSLVNNDVAAVAGGTVTDRVCNLPNVRDTTKGYGNYVQMDIGG